jgi:hypothetical protein
MNRILIEVHALIDRQERAVSLLLLQCHPQLDHLAVSITSSIYQTRKLLDCDQDKKLLSKIRAGYVQGWRELPELISSIQGPSGAALILQISSLHVD